MTTEPTSGTSDTQRSLAPTDTPLFKILALVLSAFLGGITAYKALQSEIRDTAKTAIGDHVRDAPHLDAHAVVRKALEQHLRDAAHGGGGGIPRFQLINALVDRRGPYPLETTIRVPPDRAVFLVLSGTIFASEPAELEIELFANGASISRSHVKAGNVAHWAFPTVMVAAKADTRGVLQLRLVTNGSRGGTDDRVNLAAVVFP